MRALPKKRRRRALPCVRETRAFRLRPSDAELHALTFPAFPARPRQSQLRMQSVPFKSIYSRGISRRWEEYWAAAAMNEENKDFLYELGRGANDPDHCMFLHLKRVGNAGSGWMHRERLFTSMKRSGEGWGDARGFPASCENSLERRVKHEASVFDVRSD